MESVPIIRTSPMERARRTVGGMFSHRLRLLTTFSSPIASGHRLSLGLGRPVPEPTEEAHGEDARQEGDIHPRGHGAPIHVAGIPRDRDELQDREGDVAPTERPDPEEIVLAACVERGEADADEPRPDRPRGQGGQEPWPDLFGDVRRPGETYTDGEHDA